MKGHSRITAQTLLCLYLTLLIRLPGFAQGTATNVALIPVGLARHVATEHVHANNQPYPWRYLDHTVLRDVDGNPNAYAFIFSKVGSRFSAPADLQQHIAGVTARTLAKQAAHSQPNPDASATSEEEDNDPFALDDLATVITGATTDSPLILRHFRGAPEFWVEATRMEMVASPGRRGPRRPARHVIMVTPMDFRLVTANSGAGLQAAHDTNSATKAILAGSEEVVSVHSKRTERISALRQQQAQREERERERRATTKPEDRKRYEEALAERAAALAVEWGKKRAAMTGGNWDEVEQ